MTDNNNNNNNNNNNDYDKDEIMWIGFTPYKRICKGAWMPAGNTTDLLNQNEQRLDRVFREKYGMSVEEFRRKDKEK